METHLKNWEEDYDKKFSSWQNTPHHMLKQFIRSTRQSAAKEAREEVVKELRKILNTKCENYEHDSEDCLCDYTKLDMIEELLQQLTTK